MLLYCPLEWPRAIHRVKARVCQTIARGIAEFDTHVAIGKTRVSGTITQLDTALKPVCKWEWEAGWPCKWEMGELDASKNELSIETLEIAHEGLTYSKA